MAGRGVQLLMSVATVVFGLYVVVVGGGEYTIFGWFVAALGVLGIAAVAVLPSTR